MHPVAGLLTQPVSEPECTHVAVVALVRCVVRRLVPAVNSLAALDKPTESNLRPPDTRPRLRAGQPQPQTSHV